MENIKIRAARLEDSSEIADICASSLGYECTREFVHKKLCALDNEREQVFVAETDGVVSGFVHAEKYDVLYFDTLVNILGMAVTDKYKRKGIGKALMQAAEKWAREIGAFGIRLNSGGTRTEAHKFYRSMGFDDEKMQIRFNKSFRSEL